MTGRDRLTYFNWSTGKDSALALHYLLNDPNYLVEKLVCSVNKDLERVTMHGLSRNVFNRQISELDLPCSTIELPETTDMETYNTIMKKAVEGLSDEGFRCAAFGDIFLEDLRRYREEKLRQSGVEAIFPLWGRDTSDLAREFFDLGFKAIVVCVDNSKLSESFAGREYNPDFLNDLPKEVDPCGENGEFHTFCYDGPIFKNPVSFQKGKTVVKDYGPANGNTHNYFTFRDLL